MGLNLTEVKIGKKSLGKITEKPITFGDGFYIEVRDKGKVKGGVKIKCDGYDDMLKRAKMYSFNKSVSMLGELKAGKWLNKK